MHIPVINISPLIQRTDERFALARHIGQACREFGFFYVTGHGVSLALQAQLEQLSRAFFAQDNGTKLQIGMARGGKAWRGYFPVGAELTAGRPDQKEGLYFGAELDAAHPLVQARVPLHGANLFPAEPAAMRAVVLAYIKALTELGHNIMAGLALSLGLNENYFAERYTADPLVLFRIFNYPAQGSWGPDGLESWGVGEHTDYGLLTILKQDDAGGLQVKVKGQWIDAPPLPDSFVCNLGDMLDRLTGGVYRSTPHRVRNASGRDRLSFPFFFDPHFNAFIEPLPPNDQLSDELIRDDWALRWDQASVRAFQGTYGEYLLQKVGRVFPHLSNELL